jgi:phosphoesterase RecJ-like protein
LAIVLDTSAKKLISDTRYPTAARTARMDHHIFCETICDVEVTDTSFESCCGLIAAFAQHSGLELTPVAAKALYTGMVTDSGRFRYDSTSSQTHRLAAFLMEQPFDTNDIYRNLYADDFARIQLKAKFILKIQFSPKNVAYIYTTKEEVQALNTDIFSVSRGMVGTMSDIRGVDIWVNFTETENGVLCELRSSKYNINPIAVKYGGGGHAKASGATVKSREEAMAMLRDLEQLLGE